MKKIIVLCLVISCQVIAQWVQVPVPLVSGRDFVTLGSNILAGTNNGVFVSSDNGVNWNFSSNGMTDANIFALITSGVNLFAGTFTGVFFSSDGGANWTARNSGLTGGSAASFIEKGAFIYTAQGGSVFVSGNNGTSWNPSGSGLPSLTIVNDFDILGSEIYAVTQIGIVYKFNGSTWVSSGFLGAGLNAIAVSGSNLFAGGFNGGIFFSSDGGVNWNPVNSGLTNNNISSLAVSGTNVFAGTANGVFRTANNGLTWVEVSQGINSTDKSINKLSIVGTDIFAGTTFGAWRRPLSEIITNIEADLNTSEKTFALQQNYPNPFNPSTRIQYQVSSNSDILLKVYDVLGNEVATLVDEYKAAGSYEVEFSTVETRHGVSLPSGVYFYKLQAGSFVETKKMILLR